MFNQFAGAVERAIEETTPDGVQVISLRSSRISGQGRPAVVSTVENHPDSGVVFASAVAAHLGARDPRLGDLLSLAENGLRAPTVLGAFELLVAPEPPVVRGHLVGIDTDELHLATASGYLLIGGKPRLLLPRHSFPRPTLAGQDAYLLDDSGGLGTRIGSFDAISDTPAALSANAALVEVEPTCLPARLNEGVKGLEHDPVDPLRTDTRLENLILRKDQQQSAEASARYRGIRTGQVEGIATMLDVVHILPAEVDAKCMWLVHRPSGQGDAWRLGDAGTLFVGAAKSGSKALGILVAALSGELATVMPMARILRILDADYPR